MLVFDSSIRCLISMHNLFSINFLKMFIKHADYLQHSKCVIWTNSRIPAGCLA